MSRRRGWSSPAIKFLLVSETAVVVSSLLTERHPDNLGDRRQRLAPAFFLGVLYHSAHHLALLTMLNRVAKPGATMLLESTVDEFKRHFEEMHGGADGVPGAVADPLVKAFSDAAAAGDPRPQSVEFGNWWGPFGDMVTKVDTRTDRKSVV